MQRQHLPLAIGRGIDRATGLAATSPAFPDDARNVYARDAKLAARAGMALTGFPPLPWGTDVLEIVGMQSTRDVIFAVYDRPSRQIRIFRLDTVNSNMQPLTSPADGLWGTLAPGQEFPVVVGAEAGGIVTFAHAEPVIALRLATIQYTPDPVHANVGSFATLQADLDGGGAADVYFFSVSAHLVYLVGLGFGSASDPDRGDAVRFSGPSDPTIFLAENVLYAGVPGDPVLQAIPTGNAATSGQAIGLAGTVAREAVILALLKNNAAFRMVGQDPDTFGIESLDAKYGTVSAKAAINVGGQAYCWSSDGPREVNASGTVPIAQPLELLSPLPDDFPPLGAERYCFASYDVARYLVEWDWPDVPNAATPVAGFALSLWNPKDPRWTLIERQQPVTCAGILYVLDTGAPPTPPTGYASDLIAVDA